MMIRGGMVAGMVSLGALVVSGCGLPSPIAMAVRSAMVAPHLKVAEAGQVFARSWEAVLAGDAAKQAELAGAQTALLAALDTALAEMDPQGSAPYHAPTEAKKVTQGPELCQAFRQYLESQRSLVETEYGEIVRLTGEAASDPTRLAAAKTKWDAAQARSAENLAKLQQADQAFCTAHGIEAAKGFEGW